MNKQHTAQSETPGTSNAAMMYGTQMAPPLYPRRPPPQRAQVPTVNQRPLMNMGMNPPTASQQPQSQPPPPQQMIPIQQINTMQHYYMAGGGGANFRLPYAQQPYQVPSQTQTMYVSTANTPFTTYGTNPPKYFSQIKEILDEMTKQHCGAGSPINNLRTIIEKSLNNENNLNKVVNMIFEKAVETPYLTDVYANLIKNLASIQVQSNSSVHEHVYFGQLIINKCQLEFESYLTKSSIEKATIDEAQKRALGTITLIGQLYKLKFFTDNIVLYCLKSLVGQGKEHSLECFSILFTLIATYLKDNSLRQLNTYCKKIEKIIDKGLISPTTRFLLEDLLENKQKILVQRNVNDDVIDNDEFEIIHWGSLFNMPSETPETSVSTTPTTKHNRYKPEYPWKPNHEAGKDVDFKTIEMEERVSAILNVLTPQKFQILVNQINDLSIDTEERLKGVIDLVFEKALDEPNVCANLCKCLAMKRVPVGDNGTEFVNFRRLLLNKCQKEFEKDISFEITRIKRTIDNEIGEEQNKREEYEKEITEFEREAKRRSLGNIQFIGELFKLRMLTASIIHECLQKLLRQEDEHSLECLCRLLTTTGKDMDSEKRKTTKESKKGMDSYFRQILELIKNRQISFTVRLMLHDVVELRSTNWVPRNPPPSNKDSSKVDSSRESSTMREEEKDPTLKGSPDLSEDEIATRAKPILDEFLHNTDFQEAILCISELCAPATIHFFVTTALNCVLERSAQTRQLIGQLMHDLVKTKVMTTEQYIKGLQAILSLAEDYAIDIPHIWEYLGELIAPLIKDGTIPLSFLPEAAQPCLETGCAGNFVSAVLHAVAKKVGTHEVGELWRSSNLQWSQFLLPSTNIQEFIAENKLEFTIKAREPCTNTNLSPEELKEALTALLASKQSENEEIFDWIDAHLNESQCRESSFVRALMIAVCQSVLEKNEVSFTVDEVLFRSRCSILKKYLDHSEACEINALYALQALMHQLEHPKDVLYSIFGFLYDEEVISEDAFLQWEASVDPAEQEGKTFALNSVRSFYVWLKMAENESVEEV